MSILVGLVTSSRSDLGFYLPLMRALGADPRFQLEIVATGMHLVPEFGLTVQHVEEAGFTVAHRVPSLDADDAPEAAGRAMGRGTVGFADLFSRWRPAVLVVLGDRYDMMPAALAALPMRIAVAHIAGGEVTEGAIDDILRHCLTKLSHLHFVSTEAYRARVEQLGEESRRIFVTGSLAVDNLQQTPVWSPEETAARFGLSLGGPIVLVTYHPVTLEHEQAAAQIRTLLAVLEASPLQCVFTWPNADPAWSQIRQAIEEAAGRRPDWRVLVNAGQAGYYSLMHVAAAMIGNSSSGIVEAPSFRLPVVNIGTRQRGRVRAANVIDCGYAAEEIQHALRQALSPAFRRGLQDLSNPYGDGHAAGRIVERLARLHEVPDLLRKRFVDRSPDRMVSV